MRTILQVHKKKVENGISTILIALFIFSLPFSIKINSISIILLALHFLVLGSSWRKLKALVTDQRFWAFTGLYWMYLLGMLWTTNSSEGWYLLEKNLSLFVFPLILGGTQRQIEVEKVLKLFIGAVLTAIIACFSIAIYQSVQNNLESWPFSYYNFTYRINTHPSYLAIYANTAVVFAIYLWCKVKEKTALKKILLASLILFLSFSTVFIGARVGILILVLLFAVIGISFIYGSKYRKYVIPAAVGLGCVFYLSMNLSGVSYQRLNNSGKALGERLQLWEASLDVASENTLIGVGTGDVMQELLEVYNEKDLHKFKEKKYNPHNQYLHVQNAVGIIGVMFFLIALLLGVKYALNTGNYSYLAVIAFMAIFFLIESALHLQRGVVFYAFFNSLFAFHGKSGKTR